MTRPNLLTATLFIALTITGISAQSRNRAGRALPSRPDAKRIAQRVIPSVVLVAVECRDGRSISYGSGFFVAEGLVATNRHVVECGLKGEIKLAGQDKIYPIIRQWISPDELLDLALLEVKGVNRPALSLSDGRNIAIAEKVYAAGNPKGLEGTFSDGIVSGVRQSDRLIQHTAPISPGSSGGPLLDEYGRVIGVNTLFVREGQNLNFAVPAAQLKTFVAQVRTGKALARNQPKPADRQVTVAKRPTAETRPPALATSPGSNSNGSIPSAIDPETVMAHEALESLRRLRDEWNEIDPVDGGKKDKHNYALRLSEARYAVGSALNTLGDNELKESFRLALEVYLDMDEIYEILARHNGFSRPADVSDLSPYMQKYSLPSQNNKIPIDELYAVILSVGRDRVNNIISRLGGRPDPGPVSVSAESKSWNRALKSGKAEDFEAYLEKYPSGKFADLARARTSEGIKTHQELGAIARQVVEAMVKGNKAILDRYLADDLVSNGERKGNTKQVILANAKVDTSVKSYQVEATELQLEGGKTILTYTVKYEGYQLMGPMFDRLLGPLTKRYRNSLTFKKQQGQWKIIKWDWSQISN